MPTVANSGSPAQGAASKWRSFLLGLWALGLGLFLAACAPQPLAVTHEPQRLRLVIPDSCTPLMEELAAAYQEARPWVALQVEVFDAATAEERLRSGVADLAVLSWMGGSSPLWSVPFATDAVAIVVHPGVPAEGLSLAQLQQVFLGRIGEWAEGTPVQVVSREAGSGLRAVFEAVVMDGHDVTLTALVAPDNAGVLEAVSATPGAIGYVSMARLEGKVRALSVEGVLPTPAAVRDYPLAYPLLLVAPSEPTGEVRAFIQWVLGTEGQQRVTHYLHRYAP